MANENQNTGPQNIGPNKGQTRQTISDIKEIKKEQGDFNDAIKDSINLLKQLDRSYERIESRLETLNRSSINIRDINNELAKVKQKEFITAKQLAETESKLSNDSKNRVDQYLKSQSKITELEQRKLEYQRQGNLAKVNEVETLLGEFTKLNETQRASLNIQEAEAIALKEANKIAKQGIEFGEEKLKTEKQLKNQIGLSGAALGLFAKKLGLGNQAYEEMVEKARTLQETGSKITFLDKLGTLGKTVGSGLKEAITDPLTAIPIAGAAIGGVIKGLMSMFNYILEIQDKTTKFARAMNLSTDQARKLKMEFADLSISSGDLFINSQKMMESQMEFVDALGVTNRLSNEQLATNIKLKDITGLDLETRKGIVEASTITGKSSDNITKSVLAQVVGLKQATGISFNYQKILKEASNLGGYLGLSFAKYPAQLTKSLVTVKAMGMELKQLDSLADSFLDFESSISKEFEAQLLTGRDINLTKAREAFLNNDLATAASEITNQVGSAGDFLKLNRIQAESLASAFGMSRDQMGDMLKQQEMLSKLGAKQGDSAKEQLRLGLERYKNQKALSAAIGEEAYQSLVNASAQEKIAAFIEKIKQSFADFVEKSGIIGVIERFINYLSEPKNIRAVLETLRNFFAFAVESVLSIANGVINAIDFITFGFGIDEKFERKFEKFSKEAPNRIRSLGTGGAGETVSVGDASAKKEAGISPAATSNVNTADNMSMARAPMQINLYPIAGVDSKLMSTSIGRGVGDTNKVIQ
jgi:hypothetical protein